MGLEGQDIHHLQCPVEECHHHPEDAELHQEGQDLLQDVDPLLEDVGIGPEAAQVNPDSRKEWNTCFTAMCLVTDNASTFSVV